MKPSNYTQTSLRLAFYNQLEAYIYKHRRKSTLEEFLAYYKVFRFDNGAVIFATDNKARINRQRCVSVGYNDPNKILSVTKEDLVKFKILFPFIEFKLDVSNSYVSNGWHETQLISNMLPTRKNIIDEILKEV